MISEKEYAILKKLKSSPVINEDDFSAEIYYLRKDKYIDYNIISSDEYNGYVLTSYGERAIEEFETHLQSIEHNKETVAIAKEANGIAKEANNISKKAKNWSAWAVGISILSFFAAVASIIIDVVIKCP